MAKIKATKTESVKLKCVLTTHRPKKPVLVYFCPRENKSICFISCGQPDAELQWPRMALAVQQGGEQGSTLLLCRSREDITLGYQAAR